MSTSIETITSPDEFDEPVLRATDMVAGYGRSEIVHGASIGVQREEIVSIIGPNGAGKSTLLKSIIGLCDVSGGQVLLQGQDITHVPPHGLASYGLSYAPQGDTVFPGMTVKEHLNMGGWTIDNLEKRREYVLELFPRLNDRRNQHAGSMSGGEQQMLSLARALMIDPDLLVLDEPSIGLQPSIVEDILTRIQAIRDLGASILMVEQDAVRSLQVADRAYVLEAGQLRFEGNADLLLEDEKVRDLYLGL
jgi:branched-chain amino acid transport system ATP-binding protein